MYDGSSPDLDRADADAARAVRRPVVGALARPRAARYGEPAASAGSEAYALRPGGAFFLADWTFVFFFFFVAAFFADPVGPAPRADCARCGVARRRL